MLKVNNLTVHYGDTCVVHDLDLALGHDEILMLVGPTGCGKSTILQALAGLIPISAGKIELGNWHASVHRQVAPEKRSVGMVFQDFALFPHLTVQENIAFRVSDNSLVNHWIELLGLNALRESKPSQLSGGQKQRVALARTLAHEPSFILLDEPLSSLDAALKDTLRWDIRKALKKAGVPAIWVTHDQEEALSVGDRVGVLRNGAIVQLDTPEKCFSEPASRFVAEFLGEASFLPGHISGNQVITRLGSVPTVAIQCDDSLVDLLVRPDDFSLRANSDGNGLIAWSRYEGGTRLYAVNLDDGSQVRVRVIHENRIHVGARVQIDITTTHPLAAFSRELGGIG